MCEWQQGLNDKFIIVHRLNPSAILAQLFVNLYPGESEALKNHEKLLSIGQPGMNFKKWISNYLVFFGCMQEIRGMHPSEGLLSCF